MTPPPQASSPHHRLRKTWDDFNRALRSPEPFNPFVWVYRLSAAGLDYCYCQSGLSQVVARYQLQKRWTSLIPLFVLGLVLFLLLLHFISIRKMIQERWCGSNNNDNCWAAISQDACVTYFALMILFFYFKTNLTSPGVALPSSLQNPNNSQPAVWKSTNNRGGFYGSCGYPKLDPVAEKHRVALYGPALKNNANATTKQQQQQQKTSSATTTTELPTLFPSPEPSYCDKCNITRPPRCHHCRVCNRCVLQFDHHCLCVNNCIGYNNYRYFLALLIHIVLACWYCLAVMVVPFYELIRKEQARQEAEYSNPASAAEEEEYVNLALERLYWYVARSRLFEDVPAGPVGLLGLIRSEEGLPWTVSIKIAYPFLLGVGVIMSVFLGYHLKYVSRAKTTLEYKIVLDATLSSLMEQYTTTETKFKLGATAQNPFDCGWKKNIYRIVGDKPWLLFLPVSVDPPSPFVPHQPARRDSKKAK
ncbi:zinc finger [Seminavis robusta]|uniref:Palmitoyltransferase n=1 Tax=Seminavis robusta TaxID=568900 RepID=A0A9N8E6Y4_9STRA|nr:zinc finger [Seminavis robusta]|eukprot:Sro609_g175000.1 zinc finger (475) ;mRNA; f:20691-22115